MFTGRIIFENHIYTIEGTKTECLHFFKSFKRKTLLLRLETGEKIPEYTTTLTER